MTVTKFAIALLSTETHPLSLISQMVIVALRIKFIYRQQSLTIHATLPGNCNLTPFRLSLRKSIEYNLGKKPQVMNGYFSRM